MANNTSQNKYVPLRLKWELPTNSSNGMISVLKNAVFILVYVHDNQCNNEYIDQIMKNDVQPITNGLKDEFDFFLAATIMTLYSLTDDFSDKDALMELIKNVLGQFLSALEICQEEFYDKKSTSEDAFVREVDTSNLVIGMVIKNYKELCKILVEDVLEGNSKKAQLKEWERYFLWEKKGQKFIILDIYDEPLPKKDDRQNRNIYVQYIEVILMKLLSKQKNNKYVFYITTNQLWKLLGMINNDYKSISLEDLNDKIPEYKVTPFDMNKFYQRCNVSGKYKASRI